MDPVHNSDVVLQTKWGKIKWQARNSKDALPRNIADVFIAK